MLPEPLPLPDSPFRRIDPRLRIVTAVLFSFAVALASEWAALGAGFGCAWLAIILCGLSPWRVLKRIAPAFGFILFLWAVLPLTVPGPALLRLGPLPLSAPGIALAGGITLKAAAILPAITLLIGTLPVATIGHALQRLRVPEKLVYLLLFCYRYIFVIEEEYRRLERAARLRSFRPGTNLHTYRTYAYLIAMLFLRAALRADQVHRAMLCRGFHGRFHTLEEIRFRATDRYWALALAIPPGIVTALQWLLLHP
ncbi:MAG: cobalt ECF transporter T component CbiQ [Deltaproteobacteria bacterium]|nr:cobalt ECF transporter T component CbiQ [Deltaproteobacteria bacterium]